MAFSSSSRHQHLSPATRALLFGAVAPSLPAGQQQDAGWEIQPFGSRSSIEFPLDRIWSPSPQLPAPGWRTGGEVAGHAQPARAGRLSKQLVLQHNLRKTIYIKDIDRRVTERALVTLFGKFGDVLDCRICADANSPMSFAFVEFRHAGSAESALARRPFRLGPHLLKVLPSKTAIVPVNADLMPKNNLEAERCGRTIYATNIDKCVEKIDVRKFFETLCGPVSRLRLLGNASHSTGIAFVEFATAESAMLALNCSGVYLGATPLRVSPSKTPVRCPDDEEFSF